MSASLFSPLTSVAFTIAQSRNFQKTSKNICLNSKPSNFCAKRLDIFGELHCRRGFCSIRGLKYQKTMEGSIGVRTSFNDEGVQSFEQEAFMEGSLDFREGSRLEATLNNLSKWLVSALFAAIILWRHDVEALWAAMGAVLNAILSVALKNILKQERPISTLRSDPGMPSSHAQSIFYTIIFLNLSMAEWYGINVLTATLSGFFVILGSYFSWLRVSQQLHTVSQVAVGALLGSVFSILWYWSWNAFVLNLFISFLWVRIVVVLGAIGFCLGFLFHIFRSWIFEER